MVLAWVFLALGICFEVVASSCLKTASEGKLWAIGVAIIGFAAAFGCVILALKHLEISTTYAVWSGVGTALIAIIGMSFLGESINAIKVASIGLIVLGVVGLNLAGGR